MIMYMHEFLITLLTVVTGNIIYNERIAGDNCTYIHVCRFEIVPVRSSVECAIKVTHADSGLWFYDPAESACSVCHPTQAGVSQLARGQRFHTGGTCPLCDLSVIIIRMFIAPFEITSINNTNCMFWIESISVMKWMTHHYTIFRQPFHQNLQTFY